MACTWNPLDKTSGIVLSNGDLTAEESSGSYEAVRATTSRITGKYYFELTADHTLGTLELVFGTAWIGENIAANWNASAYNAVARVAPVAGTVYGVAYDCATGKVWYSTDGVWSGDPEAGTGEADTNTNGPGNACAPYFASDNTTSSINGVTANFGVLAFDYTPPVGFSAWDDSVTFAVTSISPNTGSTAGGTPVTIVGSGFDPDATAAIGGNDLTDLTVIDNTTITGITPAGTAGAKDVVVTNP